MVDPSPRSNVYLDSDYSHFLERNEKHIHAKVSADQHSSLEHIAMQTHSSLSSVIRMAVQFFLDNFESHQSGGNGNA